MFSAGQISAVLEGHFNPVAFMRFDAAMKKSAATMSASEKQMAASSQRASRSMHAIGTAAKMSAGAGVLAFGAAVVKSISLAADFEQQLSSLKSVSGATGRQMGQLRKAAMDAGAATKYSALDAAKAQTELAKGGLSTAKILGGGLKGALSLAAAGEMELGEAAATTANALNLFGLSGSKAEHVADALATAANTTTGDVHDFAMALTQGGAAAKNAGLNLDETVVVLEALAQAGVKGSDAGTSMKTAFTHIAKPTDEAAEKMKQLGLEFFDATGTMKSLPAVAKELDQAFGGLTDQQRLAAATTIAGTDGMRALLALYDASPQSLKVYADQVRKQGTAAEVAAEKQDNFRGKLENFKGSVETAGIAIGSKLLPGLTRLAEKGTTALNAMGDSGQLDRIAASIAAGFSTAAGVLGNFAHAGADVAGVLADIGGALNLGDATNLTALVAGIAAFKVAGFVAPMVAQFARSLLLAATAAKLYGATSILSTLAASVNPITAVSLAAAGLAATFVYLAGKESHEEAAARRSADAKRDQLAAFRALSDAERGSVDAKHAAQRSTIEVERAEKRLNDVRKDPKASVTDLKDAELALTEARSRSVATHRDYNNQLAQEKKSQQEVIDKTYQRVEAAQAEVDRLKYFWDQGNRSKKLREELAAAERRLADATRDVGAAMGMASNAEINRQRIEAGRKPVTAANVEGFRKAQFLTSDMPKEIRTRFVLDDQEAVAKMGLLGMELRQLQGKEVVTKIIAKAENAQAAVAAFKAALAGVKPTTIAKIQTTAKSAASEVAAFKAVAAGVPTKKVLSILSTANTEKAAVQGLTSALNAIPREVNVFINTKRTITDYTATQKTSSRSPARRGAGEAKGSPGGYARTALVGEGRGPELVTDGSSSIVVNQPTLMDLGPEHSVIPFGDPAQKGRALGLMLDLFGIEGYAKGKKAKRKPKASPKSLPVPAAVQFGAVPEDELNKSRDDARESYQKRKKRVHDLGVDIREQRKKVAEAKGPDAKRKARGKLADLQKDHRRYKDGGDGLASLGAMRKRWQELQKQATVLRTYNREIARLDTMQETDRTKMATASKTGDADAWGDAKRHRGGILATLKEKYAKALQLAKPGSNFAAELEGKLAGIESEIADIGTEAFASPFEGGMSDDERKTLEGLEAAQSLAALTADLGDDKATASNTLGFLESILGATLADPARGGAAAIRDIADRVKQARDNVASFAGGGGGAGNDNADLQAQLDQAREATRVAKRESEINAKGLATFQGAGDIGMRGRTVQNIYTLHPGDPNTLRAIGDAATAGMGLQPYVGSSRTNLGI